MISRQTGIWPRGPTAGRVVDDEGTPIEDATIVLRDAAGRPVFRVADGTSSRGGAIDAAVENLGGRLLAGVRIVHYDAESRPDGTLSLVNLLERGLRRTDETDRPHIPDLAPGAHTVSASRVGFEATLEPSHVPVRRSTRTEVRRTRGATP